MKESVISAAWLTGMLVVAVVIFALVASLAGCTAPPGTHVVPSVHWYDTGGSRGGTVTTDGSQGNEGPQTHQISGSGDDTWGASVGLMIPMAESQDERSLQANRTLLGAINAGIGQLIRMERERDATRDLTHHTAEIGALVDGMQENTYAQRDVLDRLDLLVIEGIQQTALLKTHLPRPAGLGVEDADAAPPASPPVASDAAQPLLPAGNGSSSDGEDSYAALKAAMVALGTALALALANYFGGLRKLPQRKKRA